MRSTWARLAISGTTPPYAGVEVDLAADHRGQHRRAGLDDGRRRLVAGGLDAEDPPSSDAGGHLSSSSWMVVPGTAAARTARRSAYSGAVDVVRPHDDGVLVGLRVVALPDPGRREPEGPVELLGGVVADPDLEGQVLRSPLDGRDGQRVEQPGAEPVPVPGRIDRQRGHVTVVGHQHDAAVADHGAPDSCHQVDAAPLVAELAHEQAHRPRARVHLLLDAEHRPQVAPAHRADRHLEVFRPRDAGDCHQMPPASRVVQLISASGLRR